MLRGTVDEVVGGSNAGVVFGALAGSATVEVAMIAAEVKFAVVAVNRIVVVVVAFVGFASATFVVDAVVLVPSVVPSPVTVVMGTVVNVLV
jgi:hypothetical protein